MRREYGCPANAKREHGLQFLIDARPDQSLADVATVFQDWSARFEVEPLFPSPPFEAPAPGQGQAWGDTLFVATIPDVAFDDVRPSPGTWPMPCGPRRRLCPGDPETPIVRPEPPPEPESTSAVPLGWEHKAMRIAEAWAEIERRGRAPGINVRIGHPDTGWFPHEVWENGNLRTDLGRSFMPNEPNSQGQEPARGQQQPGHGTSTASVIIPPRVGRLTGVAPHAQAIPIRCVSSVLLYPFQPNVMRAVRYAMEQRCHVISMSLGGSAFPFLGPQVVHAAHANILVIAASGHDSAVTAEPATTWK